MTTWNIGTSVCAKSLPPTVQVPRRFRSVCCRNACGCRTYVWEQACPRSLGFCQGGVLLCHMSNITWLHPKSTNSSTHFNDTRDFKRRGDATTLRHLLVFYLVNPDVSSCSTSVLNALGFPPLRPVADAKPVACNSEPQSFTDTTSANHSHKRVKR